MSADNQLTVIEDIKERIYKIIGRNYAPVDLERLIYHLLGLLLPKVKYRRFQSLSRAGYEPKDIALICLSSLFIRDAGGNFPVLEKTFSISSLSSTPLENFERYLHAVLSQRLSETFCSLSHEIWPDYAKVRRAFLAALKTTSSWKSQKIGKDIYLFPKTGGPSRDLHSPQPPGGARVPTDTEKNLHPADNDSSQGFRNPDHSLPTADGIRQANSRQPDSDPLPPADCNPPPQQMSREEIAKTCIEAGLWGLQAPKFLRGLREAFTKENEMAALRLSDLAKAYLEVNRFHDPIRTNFSSAGTDIFSFSSSQKQSASSKVHDFIHFHASNPSFSPEAGANASGEKERLDRLHNEANAFCRAKIEKYHSRKKLSSTEKKAYTLAMDEIINDWFAGQKEQSLFFYLKSYHDGLDYRTYRKEKRKILEYLVKSCRSFLRTKLENEFIQIK